MAAEVSERIRSILSDAEAAAAALRHEAEQEAQARRRAAETEALRIVEDARREAERFLADRIHRISEMSDELLERGQSVVERLEDAEQVRSDLAGLVVALGETAARLANEVRAMPAPRGPEIAVPPRAPEPAVVPERAVEPEPQPEPESEPEGAAEPPPAGGTLEPNPVVAPPPEPPAEEPLREPTPLYPERSEPEPVEPPPAAEAEADVEPTDEEAELLERVRQAERERMRAEQDPDEPPEAEAQIEPEAVEPEYAEAAVEAPLADEDSVVDEPLGDEPESSGDAARAANGTPAATDEAIGAAGDGDLVEVHAGEQPVAGGEDAVLGARLVALQMAVAGGNRGEVESHLRRAFDLDEPDEILDDIFGTGTGADKRVVWPEASA